MPLPKSTSTPNSSNAINLVVSRGRFRFILVFFCAINVFAINLLSGRFYPISEAGAVPEETTARAGTGTGTVALSSSGPDHVINNVGAHNKDGESGEMPLSVERIDASDNHNDFTKQKVILMAGPHKTGSTSIQINLMHWINKGNHASNLAATWAWPSPWHQLTKNCIMKEKVFAMWMRAIYYGTSEEITCRQSKNTIPREQLLEFYRREFYSQWIEGKSLFIAAELMDAAAGSHDIVGNIIQQLPWNTDYSPAAIGSNEDVTIVIMYRSPRVAHLKSGWHQCCMLQGMTFYKYLVGPKTPFHEKEYLQFDSLLLAKNFLDEGLKVTLIDIEGVMEKGCDISNVVACDVLGANCNANKTFVGLENEKPQVMNNKSNMKAATSIDNITTDQKDKINSAILKYDCNYVSVLDHANVTVLYSFGIENMLKGCRKLSKIDEIADLKSLRKHIAAIAMSNEES